MAMRMGEFLVSVGVLTEAQVSEVVRMQVEGDKRKFGEIAVSKGFMEDSSIMRFTNFLSEHQESSL